MRDELYLIRASTRIRSTPPSLPPARFTVGVCSFFFVIFLSRKSLAALCKVLDGGSERRISERANVPISFPAIAVVPSIDLRESSCRRDDRLSRQIGMAKYIWF